MLKEVLLNSLIKELLIVKRLSTKIAEEHSNYRVKEGVRSNLELCQYLSTAGTSILGFWMKSDDRDYKTYFAELSSYSNRLTIAEIPAAMDAQVELAKQLFSQFSEEELWSKQVGLPWDPSNQFTLAQGILDIGIKWMTAYKLQLFLSIKMNSKEVLNTGDAWRKTEIEAAMV